MITQAEMASTLAAVRSLGALGIPVTVASRGLIEPAQWSRFASRRITHGLTRPLDLLEWHLDFGRRNPGHVLLPANDSTAWLYARYRDELAERFAIRVPCGEALTTVLLKARLYAACESLGIPTVQTWTPRCNAQLQCIPEEAYPVLVKPQCSLFSMSSLKGVIAWDRESLPEAYEKCRREVRLDPFVTDAVASAEHPLVQRFARTDSVLNVSCFVAPDGALVGARCNRKVLQFPRRTGIGVCFEPSPEAPSLLCQVEALCRKTGYFGVVEAEFVEQDGKYRLIDFNPRFYNELSLEVARGLPLPLWSYELASGQPLSPPGCDTAPRTWVNGLHLALLLAGQAVSGKLSVAEAAHWATWLLPRDGRLDAVVSWRDPLPGVVQAAGTIISAVRSPRWFWGTISAES